MADDEKHSPTTKLVPKTKPCPGKPENYVLGPRGGWSPRCWGKRRDTKERCKRPAAHGTKYCRRHGAMVPKGIAHPNYKEGAQTRKARYMQAFPVTEQGHYLAALNDPDLLGCEAEISALSVRGLELLERAKSKTPLDPIALEEAFDMLDHGMKEKNSALMAGGLTGLRSQIKEGAAGDRAWQSFQSLSSQKQRLIESERKRAIEANLYLTREQAAQFGHALLQSVARHVQDQAAVIRIVEDISIISASLHGHAGTHEVG